MTMSELDGGRPVVGVDLGGTKVLAGVVGPDQAISGRSKKSTPAKDGADAILAAIESCVREAVAASGLTLDDIAAVGIGSPGPLDPKTGVIHFSANMNVREFHLGPGLSAALGGLPVLLQNDVRVGGYGEFKLGAGRGYNSLIGAFVGTGIGGCLIMDGKIVEGSTGNAGELGHMTVKAGGPRCGCGQRGCMEALASRTAIARRIAKSVRNGQPSVFGSKIDRKSGKIKSGELAAAVQANDLVAVRAVQRSAHYLGLGLGSLVNVFGPELVIIGGGVVEALGDPYVDLIRQSARRQILVDPEMKIKFVAAALGDNAGILGASLMAREAFLSA
ncbi:ROK family protein [Isosphaeraceae bacterium EP7]